MAVIPQFTGCTHHSPYGGSSIKDIIKTLKKRGTYGAITEFNNLNSAMDYYLSCEKEGISKALGIQVSVLDTWSKDLFDKRSKKILQTGFLTIHFKTYDAYISMCRLTKPMAERAISEGKPYITMDELLSLENVTVGSGGVDGLIGKFVESEDTTSMDSIISTLHSKFKDDFYFEVRTGTGLKYWVEPMYDFRRTKVIREGMWADNEPNKLSPDGDYQKALNNIFINKSKDLGIKCVISQNFFYSETEDKIIQEVKIKNSKLDISFYDDQSIKTYTQSKDALVGYHSIPEEVFDNLVANTNAWFDKVKSIRLQTSKDGWALPILEEDSINWLYGEIKSVGRLDMSDRAMMDRLKEEIRVFKYNGKEDFIPYLKPIRDLKIWCDKEGIITNLRGSGGGCLILYLLGVSGVNPLKHDLSFERFQNEGRIKNGSVPDVDLDISPRDVVITHLKEFYGDKMVSLSTDVKLKIKGAIRDCERAILGEVRKSTEDMAVTIPDPPGDVDSYDYVFGYTDDDGAYHKGVLEIIPQLKEYADKNPNIWNAISRSLGIMRNKGGHSCAVVIAPKPIHEYIPLYNIGSNIVTGFSPKMVEAAGLLKYDILSVNTLHDVASCIKLINERTGKKLDPYTLPDDMAVYKEFHAGRTNGVFQYDTATAIPLLEGIKPANRDELSDVTAIGRPGALDAPSDDGRTMANVYIARCNGEEVRLIHEDLRPILGPTRGVMVYQEQIIRIFKEIGSMSAAEADDARRAIGKKDEALLRSTLSRLDAPALSRGWTQEQIDLMKRQILASCRYSFNKSHAISYSYLGYACQYLKVKYPLEWYAAVLNNASKTELPKFWSHCGNVVDLPDIAHSKDGFVIEDDRIRAPISILNGIGPKAYECILSARPYKDLREFVVKTKAAGTAVNKRVVINLIAGGLMDSFFKGRGYMSVSDKIYEYLKIKSEIEGSKMESVPEELRNLKRIDQYMIRKKLVTVYSMDLRDHFLGERLLLDKPSNPLLWKYKNDYYVDGSFFAFANKTIEEDPKFENTLENTNIYTFSYVIEESTRPYQNKNKQMTKILLDTNGHFEENVVWPKYGEDVAETGFSNKIVRIKWRYNPNRKSFGIKTIEKLL